MENVMTKKYNQNTMEQYGKIQLSEKIKNIYTLLSKLNKIRKKWEKI